MTTKPVYPFWGTKAQRADFIEEFRHVWQLPPDTKIKLSVGKKVARWHIPMRINGRRLYWHSESDAYPWGLIIPKLNGWNPVMSHPSELRTWLSIPKNELGAVHLANLAPQAKERRWSYLKVYAVVAAVVIAVAVIFSNVWIVPGAAAAVLILVPIRVAIVAFGNRLRRDSPFFLYQERQPPSARPRY